MGKLPFPGGLDPPGEEKPMTKPIELLALLTLLDDRKVAVPATGPAELRQTCKPEEVGQRRSLWCPAYDRCLNAALARRWRSWSCEACVFFTHARPFRALAASRAGVMRPHGPTSSVARVPPGF